VDCGGIVVRVPAGPRELCVPLSVRTGPGAHPASIGLFTPG